MDQNSASSQTWHAVDTEAVLRKFDVPQNHGLNADEVQRRREQHGANQLQEAETRSAVALLLQQFKSIVIIILAVASVVAFATERWPEGIALLAVTIVNTAIGFFCEWKAVRSMEALRSLSEHRTLVRRDGRDKEVDAEQLVPGDIVLIREETLAPADIRLLKSEQLRVNEAALTGESVPVHKTTDALSEDTELAERTNMLYKGTSIVEGSGEGLVVGTGMQTELGRISEMAEQAQDQATPLQQKLDRLGRKLAWITLLIAAIVGAAGLAAGRDTVRMIETAIALGIAAVPEGLPVVATIALARGMYLMARRNALVNRLTAVETLGATRVILTDKTGTLTENEMSVRRVVTPSGEHELNSQPADDQRSDQLLVRVLEIGVFCNNAKLPTADGDDSSGDPTEVALLDVGQKFGLSRDDLLNLAPEENEVAFDPAVMMMATYHQADDQMFVAVKGSPEAVLAACTQIAVPASDASSAQNSANDSLAAVSVKDSVLASRAFSDSEREEWLQRANDLASQGLRLLAMADRSVESRDDEPYQKLRFVGLVGMVDPPRSEITEAIEQCQSAGIRVIMVTGDRPDTGQAIGEQVGIADEGTAVRGSEIRDWDNLSDAEREQLLDASVFARVTPEQKLNLVRFYQDQGEIVAMTGDGVNDAPALKQADIGVAMGQRGTDAAKQMADMVLRDDQFSTIVAAVRQGRIIFANIRQSVIFMLCTNLAEILAVTAASLSGVPIPLKPLQILFLNVLTDVFPALALGVGQGSGEVMKQRPRDPQESVLTKKHWLAIGGWSLIIGTCVLIALGLALTWLGLSETQAVTVSFLTLGFSKMWFVLNLRDRNSNVWNNDIVQNPWVRRSIVFCTGLLLAAVYWPWLSGVLQTETPGGRGWILILAVSLVPAVLGLFVPGIPMYSAARAKDSDKN